MFVGSGGGGPPGYRQRNSRNDRISGSPSLSMLGGVLDFSEVRFRGRGARGRVLLIEIYKMMSRRAYV